LPSAKARPFHGGERKKKRKTALFPPVTGEKKKRGVDLAPFTDKGKKKPAIPAKKGKKKLERPNL